MKKSIYVYDISYASDIVTRVQKQIYHALFLNQHEYEQLISSNCFYFDSDVIMVSCTTNILTCLTGEMLYPQYRSDGVEM